MKKILLTLAAVLALTACSKEVTKDSLLKAFQNNNLEVKTMENREVDAATKSMAKEMISISLPNGSELRAFICEQKSKCDQMYTLQQAFMGNDVDYLKQSKGGELIFMGTAGWLGDTSTKLTSEQKQKLDSILEQF